MKLGQRRLERRGIRRTLGQRGLEPRDRRRVISRQVAGPGQFQRDQRIARRTLQRRLLRRERARHVAARAQRHAKAEQRLRVVRIERERRAVSRLGRVEALQRQFGVGQRPVHGDVRAGILREGRQHLRRPLRPARERVEQREIELHPQIVRRRARDPALEGRDRARHVALLAQHQTHALVRVPVGGVEPERVDEMAPRGRPVALGQPHVAELGPGADPGGLDLRRPLEGLGRAFQIALPGQDDAEDLVTRRQIRRAGEHRARQRARRLRVALPDERERPAQVRLVGVDLLDAADRHREDRRGLPQDQPREKQDRDQTGR